ncbi:hypothetical protein ACRC7T_12975 [Segnochrobactraceae bacterium EtOH-i3]
MNFLGQLEEIIKNNNTTNYRNNTTKNEDDKNTTRLNTDDINRHTSNIDQRIERVERIIRTFDLEGRSSKLRKMDDISSKNSERLSIIGDKISYIDENLNSINLTLDKYNKIIAKNRNFERDVENIDAGQIKIQHILTALHKESNSIESKNEDASLILEKIKSYEMEAKEILKLCAEARAAATATGLATAFSKESHKLIKSMYVWLIALIFSLLCSIIIGYFKFDKIIDLSNSHEISTYAIVTNITLSIISIGAPIWLAWLSTKQIRQHFILSQDYAFKATVASTYEGFRQQASRIDPELEKRLLSSALDRVDEVPIRLIDQNSHGSPIHDLISSKSIEDLSKNAPIIIEKFHSLITTIFDKMDKNKR